MSANEQRAAFYRKAASENYNRAKELDAWSVKCYENYASERRQKRLDRLAGK